MNLGNRGLATGRILWKNTIELIISLISSLISKWNIIRVVSVLVSRLIQGQATKIFQSFFKCREGALLSDKVQGPRSNDQTAIWDLFQAHFAYLHSRNPCRIKLHLLVSTKIIGTSKIKSHVLDFICEYNGFEASPTL